MGRGRAKAKQTRVARDLKYRDVGTDLNQLQRELQKASTGTNGHSPAEPSKHDDSAEEEGRYSSYADYDDDEDDDDDLEGEDDGGSHLSHHRQG
jgi:hypothetical protein